MQLDIVIAFFILGAVARALRSPLSFPPAMYQFLTIFLMLAIGLKGGVALASHADADLLKQTAAVLGFGLALPLLAYPLLRRIGGLERTDSASIAAHYGSVSVGTYAVAVAVLEAQQIDYEPYFPLFVVLLEVPAILVGLALVQRHNSQTSLKQLGHELFCNQGMVLMVGALLIGFWAGDRVDSVTPLFKDLFHGMLALFLLEMGMSAADRFGDLRKNATFISTFGVFMPLVGGALGALLGTWMGLSVGGATLLAVLGGSASYIAVPAVMRQALPEANHGLSIAASLGVTFPFNVMVGIPLYLLMSQWLGA